MTFWKKIPCGHFFFKSLVGGFMFLHSMRKQDNIDKADVRTFCVSVRLNEAELQKLDAGRGRFRRGEAMRMAALVSLPTPVSKLDLDAWVALGKSANNLNQLTHSLNSKEAVDVMEIREILSDFRIKLLTIVG
jgi:hypothetical protein